MAKWHLQHGYKRNPIGANFHLKHPQILGIEPSVASSSNPPSREPSKKTNDRLLKAAVPYIKAILAPEDAKFPRLECPQPDDPGRYQYLRLKQHQITKGDADTPVRYFFALDLYQCRELLPRLLGSVIDAMRFLGPSNCALSVVEGRSDDGTYEVLASLRPKVENLGAKYFLQTNEVNPKAEGADRIKALSELRNQALQPLIDLDTGEDTAAATVIFINDVAICLEDILELIHQRQYQEADMTCAMDWTYVGADPSFYDVWIARGMNGDSFFNIPPDGSWDSAWNLFWNDPDSKQRLDAGKSLQVFSCWNGAVAFIAKPVQEQQIKFRSAVKDECYQGEPKSFCKDLWTLGYGKIAVVPSINLEYSDENARRVKSIKGYVSDFVAEKAVDDKIEWKSSPPEKVKCMAGWGNQFWRPWDEQVDTST
ncbi:MAG: hypothetical protein Q9206_005703 [Seirophora lacunosa]